jgi:hypothetical protein
MRFSLGKLLLAFVVLSIICYAMSQMWQTYREARETAVWSDYQGGFITREQAREQVGERANTWEKGKPQRPQ